MTDCICKQYHIYVKLYHRGLSAMDADQFLNSGLIYDANRTIFKT